VVGLALTAVLTVVVRDSTLETRRDTFEVKADRLTESVNRQIERYVDKLQDIGAFVANAPGTSNERFRSYVTDSELFEQLPSIVGVFFIAQVQAADLPAFLEQIRVANPDFSVALIGDEVRQPDDPYYLLTYYMPGKVDLLLPIGTDVSAIPSVDELIGRSNETGSGILGSFQQDPVLQEIARIDQFAVLDGLLSLDFFIGVPVYDADGAPGGDRLPIGWVGASIDDFDEVARATTEGKPDDVGLSLEVNLSDTGTGSLDEVARIAEQPGESGPRSEAAFEKSGSFEVEGVNWTLTVWSPGDADALSPWVRFTAVAGLLVSALAARLAQLRHLARDDERILAREIRDREQSQRDILESVPSPMVVLDADGRITGANPAWAELVAATDGTSAVHPATTVTTRSTTTYPAVLRPSMLRDGQGLVDAVAAVLAGRADTADVDVALEEGSGGRWYAVRVSRLRGSGGGAVVIHTDITQRKRSHDELRLQASRDPLTGVLNRVAFGEALTAALAQANTGGSAPALLFIDLDGFKPINDTFGHATGDAVLRAVAHRIAGVVRATDQVGRLGGDEFVVLLDPVPDARVAEATAGRVHRALSTPVHVDGLDIPLRASIGVALVDSLRHETADGLLQRGDAAMYVAKHSGGDRYVVG
jgi:diguanylate cyclase (GGDEF)-like protein